MSVQHLPAWADNSTHDLTLTLWANLSSRTVKTIKIHELVDLVYINIVDNSVENAEKPLFYTVLKVCLP